MRMLTVDRCFINVLLYISCHVLYNRHITFWAMILVGHIRFGRHNAFTVWPGATGPGGALTGNNTVALALLRVQAIQMHPEPATSQSHAHQQCPCESLAHASTPRNVYEQQAQ